MGYGSVGSHEPMSFSESPGIAGFMNLNLQQRGIHESESPENQGFGLRIHRTEGFIGFPGITAKTLICAENITFETSGGCNGHTKEGGSGRADRNAFRNAFLAHPFGTFPLPPQLRSSCAVTCSAIDTRIVDGAHV